MEQEEEAAAGGGWGKSCATTGGINNAAFLRACASERAPACADGMHGHLVIFLNSACVFERQESKFTEKRANWNPLHVRRTPNMSHANV